MNQDVYRSKGNSGSSSCHERKWSALDDRNEHPMAAFCDPDNGVEQEAVQNSTQLQLSEELVYIKDSCDVNVTSTDVKAALSLQAALQAAIVVVISISIADSSRAEQITQELLQSSKISQITRQKTIIENSRNIEVTTTDAQVAVNIQLLLQLLLALIVELDIL